MIILRRYSATKVIGTNGAPGFISGRKYDTDLDRLGRSSTQRELREVGDLGKEIRKMNKELNNGRTGKWLYTD